MIEPNTKLSPKEKKRLEELAGMIESRIISEKRKYEHLGMDWIKIASLKIAKTIVEQEAKK